VHRVRILNVNLEERIEFVISKIKEYGEINFTALFEPTDDKLVWIVTFIAILELVKNQVIMALQSETFGEIILRMLDGIETA